MNFQLRRGTSTLDIHVMDVGDMFRFTTRMDLRSTSREHTTRIQGDEVPMVHPITFTVHIDEADENTARNKVDEIVGFLEDATDIKRISTDRIPLWRALNTPCLAFARGTPLNAARNEWQLELTLLTRFPKWTRVRTTSLSTYDTEERPDIVTTGLVAEWRFDEGTGQVLTDYWGENDGDIVGATWSGDDGLDFDGVDDYAEVPNSDAIDITSSAFCFEAVVYPRNYAQGEIYLCNKENQYEVGLRGASGGAHTLDAAIDTVAGGATWQWISSGQSVPENEWSHVAVSYDGTDVRFYFNGALVATVANSATGAIGSETTPLHFGSRRANYQPSSMVLAYVNLYEYVPSDAEVEQNYKALQHEMGMRGVGI